MNDDACSTSFDLDAFCKSAGADTHPDGSYMTTIELMELPPTCRKLPEDTFGPWKLQRLLVDGAWRMQELRSFDYFTTSYDEVCALLRRAAEWPDGTLATIRTVTRRVPARDARNDGKWWKCEAIAGAAPFYVVWVMGKGSIWNGASPPYRAASLAEALALMEDPDEMECYAKWIREGHVVTSGTEEVG